MDNSYMQNYMAGAQLALEHHRIATEQERAKQQREIELANLEIRKKQINLETKKEQYNLLNGSPGQVVPDTSPGNELPALGMPGGPDYQPAVPLGGTMVLPHPKVTFGPEEGFSQSISVQPLTLQEKLQQNRLAQIQGLNDKVTEAQAIEATRPPYKSSPLGIFNEQTGEIKTPATPKSQEPTYSLDNVTVNGKGPTLAIVKKTPEGVQFLDPNTRQPIQGAVGAYERPRQTAAASGTQAADVEDTARGIAEGTISPQISQSVSMRDRTAVSGALKRLGYNQAEAERDWKAINHHISTLNGAQQERLRQAITFTNDTLPQIEEAYAAWKKQAGVSGFKVLNKATLRTMENLPGQAGSAAHNLEALISDFTSELGTVYKGGNSSTDESLKLAGQNLQSDWNETTFNDAIRRLRTSLQIRKNSISTSEAVGVSPNSPYQPQRGGGSGREINYADLPK